MSGNRKILLISYYFPPLGMGGTGRVRALHKYLPKFGFDVFTLTVKNIVYPEYDHTLMEGLNRNRIIRSGSLDPARLLYLLGKRKSDGAVLQKGRRLFLFNYPDSKRFWNTLAYRQAIEICRREKISAVITSSPPPSAHMMGIKLKSKLGIPWVADFRDLWFSLPIEKIYGSKSSREFSLKLKKEIAERADEVVSVNQDIRKYLGRGEVIRNGAEVSLRENWQKASSDARADIAIGVLGTMNYLCPIEPLLAAVKKLSEKYQDMAQRMKVIHVGHCDRAEMECLRNKYGMGSRLVLKGYLPRVEAIAALSSCEMLFFSVEKFSEYNILPGRIFDYLFSGKPIIASVPPGSEAEELLSEYPAAIMVTDGDISRIAEGIKKFADNAGMETGLSEQSLRKYSAESVAQNYARMLDRVLK